MKLLFLAREELRSMKQRGMIRCPDFCSSWWLERVTTDGTGSVDWGCDTLIIARCADRTLTPLFVLKCEAVVRAIADARTGQRLRRKGDHAAALLRGVDARSARVFIRDRKVDVHRREVCATQTVQSMIYIPQFAILPQTVSCCVSTHKKSETYTKT